MKTKQNKFMENLGAYVNNTYRGATVYSFDPIGVLSEFKVGKLYGGIILGSGVVTPKDVVLDLAKKITELEHDHWVSSRFGIMDKQTALDGRFNPYTPQFIEFLKQNARILTRINDLPDMNALSKRKMTQQCADHLQRSRDLLLYSYGFEGKDYFDCAVQLLSLVTNYPTKLALMLDEEKIAPKVRGRIETDLLLANGSPQVEGLREIEGNPRSFLSHISGEHGHEFLAQCVTELEKMVLGYMIRLPGQNISGERAGSLPVDTKKRKK